jgi:uncharacterized OB-fold protein
MSVIVQRCAECGAISYPAREACRNCLGARLEPVPVSGAGVLLARSTLYASGEAFFRERLPWRIGTVRLDCGAILIVHRGDGVDRIGDPVEVEARTLNDRSAFVANPRIEP